MESFGKMRRMQQEDKLPTFDCGDNDLNDFFVSAAKPYQKELLSVTYYSVNDSDAVYFFSLSNDKITSVEHSASFWRKLKSFIPHSKHRKDYPAVKIGRFGINAKYQNRGVGSDVLNFIKAWMVHENKTGCRFITIDAYMSAVPFYLRNGFKFMGKLEEQRYSRNIGNTVSLFYDLKAITAI